MTRQGLKRRLEALEAMRPGDALFVLDDGRTVRISIMAVLSVFTDGAPWLYPDAGDPPAGPLPPHVELLARVVHTPDDSLLCKSVVAIAQAARQAYETAGSPS